MAEPVTPLDPLSLAIGRLEGRLEGIERELAAVHADLGRYATKAELRAWGALHTLLLAAIIARLLLHS